MVEQYAASEDFSTVAEGQAFEKTAKPVFNEITSKDIKEVFSQVPRGISSALEQYLPKLSLEDKDGTLKTGKSLKDTNCLQDPKELKDPKELLAKLAKIEQPLNKAEHKMLASLRESMRGGDLNGTQRMLQALAADPMSAQRVLGKLQRQLENENPLRTLGYAIGKDENGNVSVHMKLSERIGPAKGDPVNIVSLDSNGPARAVYLKNGESYKRDPEQTLAGMLRPNPPRKK